MEPSGKPGHDVRELLVNNPRKSQVHDFRLEKHALDRVIQGKDHTAVQWR